MTDDYEQRVDAVDSQASDLDGSLSPETPPEDTDDPADAPAQEPPETAHAPADGAPGRGLFEEDIFSPIYGHDGCKALLASALHDGSVHPLMIGPPGCGKSTFLMRLEEYVPGAVYKSGDAITEAKLRDILAEDPPLLLIDEIEALSPDAFEALAVPMEHGRVAKSTAHESYDVQIDTQIVAACNHVEQIPLHIQSRFRDIQLEEYTSDQYLDVCEKMIVEMVEWVETPDEARYIAKTTREVTGRADPREARQVARLAGSMDRVDKIAKAMHDPEADIGHTSLHVTEIAAAQGSLEEYRVREMLREDMAQQVLGDGDGAAEAARDRSSGQDTAPASAPAADPVAGLGTGGSADDAGDPQGERPEDGAPADEAEEVTDGAPRAPADDAGSGGAGTGAGAGDDGEEIEDEIEAQIERSLRP